MSLSLINSTNLDLFSSTFNDGNQTLLGFLSFKKLRSIIFAVTTSFAVMGPNNLAAGRDFTIKKFLNHSVIWYFFSAFEKDGAENLTSHELQAKILTCHS